MKIRPTPNNVLIKPLAHSGRTKSGIYLAKKQKGQRGKVVAIGKRILQDGTKGTPEFKVGDTIIHKRWEGQEIKFSFNEKPLIFIKYEDVLAREVAK